MPPFKGQWDATIIILLQQLFASMCLQSRQRRPCLICLYSASRKKKTAVN